MEAWMILQGVGAVGAVVGLFGAAVAARRGKKPQAALALLLTLVCGFLVLNATALVPSPQSDLDQEMADFDDPL